mgnify:CR=1 FL=1
MQIGGPGPKDHPAASHKIVHNYKTLREMFVFAGFEVRLLEYCDENGIFHYKQWYGADDIIFQSKKYVPRNQRNQLVFPSLIVDVLNVSSYRPDIMGLRTEDDIVLGLLQNVCGPADEAACGECWCKQLFIHV